MSYLADVQRVKAFEEQDTAWYEDTAEAMTKGVVGSVISGFYGLANTGIALGNSLGLDNEKYDVADQVEDIAGTDIAKYYTEHKDTLDMVGMIGTSFIPGTLAMKGLRAVQGSSYLNKSGTMANGLKTMVGSPKPIDELVSSIKAVGAGQKTYKQLRMGMITGNFKQQALEALAFETGVLLTMNQNASLNPDDLGYFEAIQANLGHAGAGVILGAGVGGVITSIQGKHALLKAQGKFIDDAGATLSNAGDATHTAASAGDNLVAQTSQLLKATPESELGEIGKQTKGAYSKNIEAMKSRAQSEAMRLTTSLGTDASAIATDLASRVFESAVHREAVAGATKFERVSKKMLNFDQHGQQLLNAPTFAKGTDILETAFMANTKASGVYTKSRTKQMAALMKHGVSKATPEMDAAAITFGNTSQVKTFLASTAGKGLKDEMYEVLGTMSAYSQDAKKLKNWSKTSHLELGKINMKGKGLSNPEVELGAMIRAHRAMGHTKFSKIAPRLAKVLDGNEPMTERFLDQKAALNLESGKVTLLPDSTLAADLGPVRLTDSGGTVRATYTDAEGLDKVTNLSTGFHVDSLNPLEATARWAGVQQLKEPQVLKLLSGYINKNDLPLMQRTITMLRSGVNVQLNKLMLDGKLAYGNADNVIRSAQGLENLLIESKISTFTELMTKREYTAAQLSDILDVSPKFVNQVGVTKKGWETAEVMRNQNYNKIRTVEATYESIDPNTYMPMIRGEAAIRTSINALRDLVDSEVATQLGPLYDMLPKRMQDLMAEGINSSTNTVGALTASQGTDIAKQYFQGIGKFLNTFNTKISEDVAAKLGPLKAAITKDTTAVAELNTLNTKLQQAQYGVISSKKLELAGIKELDGVTVKEGKNYVLSGDAIEEVMDAITKGIDPITGKVLYGATKKPMKLSAGSRQFSSATARGRQVSANTEFLEIQSDLAGELLIKLAKRNARMVSKDTGLKRVTGKTNMYNKFVLPAVAVDLNKVPHWANVEFKGIGGAGVGTAKINAISEADLDSKILNLKAEYGSSVKTTLGRDVEQGLKRLDAFDYELGLTSKATDTNLQKAGVGWEASTEFNKDIVDNLINLSVKRDVQHNKNMIMAKYQEDFNYLKLRSGTVAESVKGADGVTAVGASTYQKIMNEALNVKNIDEMSTWFKIQETTAQAVDNAWATIAGIGYKMERAVGSKKLETEFAALEQAYKDYNLPMALGSDASEYIISSAVASREVVTPLVTKANHLLSTLMLRADFTQPLITAMSTPVILMPELSSVKSQVTEEVWKKMVDVGKIKVPGQELKFSSNLKIMAQATKDYWKKEAVVDAVTGVTVMKNKLLDEYTEMGIVGTVLQDVVALSEELGVAIGGLGKGGGESILAKFIDTVGPKITALSDKSEEMVKFIAARSADIVLEEGMKHADDAGRAFLKGVRSVILNSAVSRVHGNYVASQRPLLFQGFAGQALGLFQTYQFNLIQAAGRHIAQGESGRFATMATAQAGLFGGAALPGYQLVNDYIGRNNDEHRDINTNLGDVVGEEAAEWLLYGVPSNVFNINFFTRGDMTPRTPILLPTSVADVPIVAMATKFVSNVANTYKMMGSDGDGMDILMSTIAHNGLNRPLAGMAQLYRGEKDTINGTKIMDYDDIDAGLSHVAAKLIGTQSMNEAIAMRGFYKTKEYRMHKQKELNSLGSGLRSYIRGGQDRDNDISWAHEYAQKGGDIDNFNQWYKYQLTQVKDSRIQELRNSTDTSEGRYLQDLMSTDF